MDLPLALNVIGMEGGVQKREHIKPESKAFTAKAPSAFEFLSALHTFLLFFFVFLEKSLQHFVFKNLQVRAERHLQSLHLFCCL